MPACQKLWKEGIAGRGNLKLLIVSFQDIGSVPQGQKAWEGKFNGSPSSPSMQGPLAKQILSVQLGNREIRGGGRNRKRERES